MLRADVFAGHYVYSSQEGDQTVMSLTETRETKATMIADAGKVLAWANDREPRHISLAVPGDRAKMTPRQARELADWLIKAASERETAEAIRSGSTIRVPRLY